MFDNSLNRKGEESALELGKKEGALLVERLGNVLFEKK